MKIRNLLIVTLACFSIIPMIIYSIFANIQLNGNAKEQYSDLITDILGSQVTTITTYVNDAKAQIQSVASYDAVKKTASNASSSTLKDSADYKTAKNIFEVTASESTYIDKIVLTDANGKIILSSDSEDSGSLSGFLQLPNYNDDTLYIATINEEKTIDTFFIKTKVNNCYIIEYYNCKFFYDSDSITGLLTLTSFGNNGRVFIVDPKLSIFDVKTYTGQLDQKSEYTQIYNKFSQLGSVVNAPTLVTYQSQSGVSTIAGIVSAGETGWNIVAVGETEKAYFYSSDLGGSITVVAVLMSILALAGNIVLVIIITKPLQKIEETLLKIRRGDHEARIDVMSNNEYGEIARAFNDLIDEIVVSEDRYRTIIEMSDNIIFEWNFKTNEVFFSNNFNKKFSYRAPSDHFGDSFLLKCKVHPDDAERYKKDLEILGRGGEFKQNEYRMKNIYGDFIWVLIRTATLKDREENPLKVVGVMVDIDRAKKSEQQLTARASFDALTELYNRETIENQIENEIELSAVRKSELALLFVDVDDFKNFNDNYSHATGDQVLKFVASTIRRIVDEFGFAGRYGGDEFVICVRNADINVPTKVAQDLIQRLNEGFVSDATNDKLTVNVSIGIAVVNDTNTMTVEKLICMADDAMYKVKKSGKSNYGFI